MRKIPTTNAPVKIRTCTVIAVLLAANCFAQIPNSLDTKSQQNNQQLVASAIKDQKAIKIWWNSWLGIYSAATLVQTGIAIKTENKPLKQDMYLGAATTLLGAGAQLFTPVVKLNLNQINSIDDMSVKSHEELMQNAQEYLKEAADYEKNIRSWKNHALSTSVNLASGLITWLAFDRTLKDGIVNFAINEAITETQIWTQPIIAKKALKNYTNQFSAGNYVPQPKKQVTLMAGAMANGLQFKVIF